MAWRGESWADVVARAASADPSRRRSVEDEDPAALAKRARPWLWMSPAHARLQIVPNGIVVGAGMDAIEIAFPQLYHVEPVDPWPSLALGWVERGEPYSTVLTPIEPPEPFALVVEDLLTAHAGRLRAFARGWLAYPIEAWERVDAMPGEREEGPTMRGYRMAPQVEDPVVARHAIARGGASLWTWIASRLAPSRRVDPKEIVLTQRFVYVRTTSGARLRLPASSLRASRRTSVDEVVYTLGRNTELLVVGRDAGELVGALDARVSG